MDKCQYPRAFTVGQEGIQIMDFMKVLYIDPGTGGMLFTVLFGLFGVVVFSMRALAMRLKFSVGSDKNAKINNKKIPIAIFAESKRYWNTFAPILDEFEKRKKNVVYLTCSEDDPVFKKKYEYVSAEFIGEGNKAFSRLNLLNASVVLSTTPSLDVFQWKRSKSVKYYVHLPHMANDITTYKMFGLDFYDAVLLSGQYQIDEIRRLEKMREIPAKDLKLAGIPYMDKMLERLENTTRRETDKKDPVVLLAPSWGNNGILTAYGAPFIENLLKTGYRIIIRPHPQSFTADKDIIDGLNQAYAASK